MTSLQKANQPILNRLNLRDKVPASSYQALHGVNFLRHDLVSKKFCLTVRYRTETWLNFVP